MKKFLAVFTGNEAAFEQSGWNALPAEERQRREAAGIQAWTDWSREHAAAIVDHGGPLGKTKRAAPDGITDIRNSIAGYVVVQAESHDAAARIFERHPHFTVFPGLSVEIMQCNPMP